MDVTASALAELNDKRKFKEAARWYNLAVQEAGDPTTNVDVHFQGFLALSMIGEPTEKAQERIAACPVSTKIVLGDVMRDVARQMMRNPDGNLAEARQLLNKAADIHSSSKVASATFDAHYWADQASLARLDYIEGNYGLAYESLCNVVEKLEEIDSAPHAPLEAQTYLRNAAFDGLRATLRLSEASDEAAYFAKIVIDLDPSWKKRWAARVIHRAGWPALIVIEYFFS